MSGLLPGKYIQAGDKPAGKPTRAARQPLHLVKAGVCVQGEGHAGAGQVGAHHLLNADRKTDLEMVKACQEGLVRPKQ